jgi:antirestriction protein
VIVNEGEDQPREPGPEPGEPRESESQEAFDERAVPRIYVASLADYHAGRWHGAWIDAAQQPADLFDDIQAMLGESPESEAQEWAICAFEGFEPVSMATDDSLELVQEVAGGIAAYGEPFAVYVQEIAARERSLLPAFPDVYQGKWESLRAYVEVVAVATRQAAEEAGLVDELRYWLDVDLDELTAEVAAEGYVVTAEASDGGVYVFDLEAEPKEGGDT